VTAGADADRRGAGRQTALGRAVAGATEKPIAAARGGDSAGLPNGSAAPDFPIPIFEDEAFSTQRFLNPVSLGFERGCSVALCSARASVRIHEGGARARADDADGPGRGGLSLRHEEAPHPRQDPQTRRAGHRYLPEVQEADFAAGAARNFPRCERRAILKPSVLFR
jgi:hypothetical protein